MITYGAFIATEAQSVKPSVGGKPYWTRDCGDFHHLSGDGVLSGRR